MKIRKSSKILIHRAVLAVPTFHIKLLFPRVPKKPSLESRKQRNYTRGSEYSREAFFIVNMLDEILMNYLMIQEIWRHCWREGIEKVESEEPLQSIPLLCFWGRAREKSLDDRNCLKSMTHHAPGIGTCTRSGMTIPSHPSSQIHLEKFLDHTEFQSWIVNFRTEVCSKAKNPTRAFAVVFLAVP